jgi:uncharacterized membrane protein SpoIIM required for sporulation
MVLETLLTFKENPKHLLFSGFIFSSIAILLSLALFPRAPSMVLVAFMTIPTVYIFTQMFKKIGAEELELNSTNDVLTANTKVAENYLFLFLGMSLGIVVWFSILPKDMLLSAFSEQLWNLEQLGRATGMSVGTASAANINLLSTIAINNIRLVLLCALMSFVFGTGSLFILAWNASVIGVAVGTIIYQLKQVGIATEFAFFQGMTMGVSYFILHLVPEVMAYFYAAIAGAFISIAMMRYQPFSKKSNRLLVIAGGLLGIAVIFVIFGAFIEVFISYYIQSVYI